MTEKFANNAASTLNGGINSSVTTLVVTSAAGFPTSGNFRLLLGTSTGEIVLVTGVSGTTFTIVRAQENTTASSWTDQTPATHILTAGSVLQVTTGGGDLSGPVESATVTKIQGHLVTPQTLSTAQDGYLMTWDNTDGYWAAKPLANKYAASVKTTNYTMTASDELVFADASSSAFTITLPSSPLLGQWHKIKDHKGNAFTNNITISGNGANIEQFFGDPASSLALTQNYDAVELVFNGTTWSIL